MKIKFIASNDAEVIIKAEELATFGVSAESLSFFSGSERKLIALLFDALEDVCGLHRDGKFALVECHPYLSGNCRIEFRFIDEPSPRLYIFNSADDMLDAMNHLSYNDYFNTSCLDIKPVENKFFMYIPQTAAVSEHNFAVLSEYCA